MSFASDFGLRLIRDGASPDMDVHIVPFELDHISIVSDELFTTISNMEFDGEPHAVSLDFGVKILEAIRVLCSDEIAQFIAGQLSANSFEGYTIELPEPVALAVTARLGKMQTAEKEQYVPLVVQSVSKVSAE
ncbi:MAG: hypothetical protein M3511_09685 [Deinococcota bacterium]|nr:hypothetical protein [Deinococcota bacterium]